MPRPLGREIEGSGYGARRERGQGRGPVLDRMVADEAVREPVAVEGFRRRLAEERMLQEPGEKLLVRRAARRVASVLVEGAPGPLAHPVVDQGVAGPGIEGDEPLVRPDEGDVGDAAEIEDGERPFEPAHLGEGAVEDGHQRSPLPSPLHVGGTKIVDHGDAEAPGERGAVAELHRQARFRTVQHRLAVEADHVDRVRRHAAIAEEALDGFGVQARHHLFGGA